MSNLHSVDFINSQGKIMMINEINVKQISSYKKNVDESLFGASSSVVVLRQIEAIFDILGGAENRCLSLSTLNESRFYFQFCGIFDPSIILQNYKKPLENESVLRHKNGGEELFTVKQN